MSEANIHTPRALDRGRPVARRRAALPPSSLPAPERDPAVTAYDELWFQGRPQLP
jgi:hypothetical protein